MAQHIKNLKFGLFEVFRFLKTLHPSTAP